VPAVPLFADVTTRQGLPAVGAQFVNWLDIDADLCPDLLVDGCRLFRNSGPPEFQFVEVTQTTGLAGAKPTSAVCVDLDNDGHVDIVTTDGHFWRNLDGRRFVDVAVDTGFRPHAKAGVLGCGDVNGDGFADLYVGMKEDWNDGKPTYYPHQLWLNDGGTRFREVGAEAGIAKSTYARTVLFSDVNGDGRQDIFVANYRLQANLLWLNLGDVRFREAAVKFGVAGRYEPNRYYDRVLQRHSGPQRGHTIGACWGDLNNDGQLDLFTANLVHKYVGPSNLEGMGYDIRGYVCDDSAIYLREGNRFVDGRARLGVALMPIGGPGVCKGDELWAGCMAGDANNDGWTDVFVPQIYDLEYATTKLFLNHGGERLADCATQAGICRLDTYAGAWADIDRDGWLDLVTAGRPGLHQPARLCLYRNQGIPDAGACHWLQVRLRQGTSRRTLLGTSVTIHQPGGDVLYQEFGAGNGCYGQQNDPTLHFGLGPVVGRVRVSIRWPDGSRQEIEAAPDGRLEAAPQSGLACAREEVSGFGCQVSGRSGGSNGRNGPNGRLAAWIHPPRPPPPEPRTPNPEPRTLNPEPRSRTVSNTLHDLNREHGKPGQIEFKPGPGGLTVAEIATPQATATVALLGGHVMSYQPHGQAPVLWMSRQSWFELGRPIRGGIPVCWPWFGSHRTDPSKPGHGFARRCLWEVVDTGVQPDGAVTLRLGLSDSAVTLAEWPHAFRLEIAVTVGSVLDVALYMRNTGTVAFTCTAALHNYFTVGDIAQAAVHGLDGCTYMDTVGEWRKCVQAGPVRFSAETDGVYLDTTAETVIEDASLGRHIRVGKRGSRSTVVWNPWIAKAKRMPDFGDDEYQTMVCVEAAITDANAVTLQPGGEHVLGTVISRAAGK